MFDRKGFVEKFADLIEEMDRLNRLFKNERREKEKAIERTNAALTQCKSVIEKLANELHDEVGNIGLVKDARVLISILEGYTEPYAPSTTYPDVKDLKTMEPYVSWLRERNKND